LIILTKKNDDKIEKEETKDEKPKDEKPKDEEPKVDEDDDPEEFLCPITQDVMEDPVIAEDGHTYERTAIVTWVEKHGTSPITTDPINKNILITNRVLKSQIDAYLEKKNPDKKPKEKKPKEKRERPQIKKASETKRIESINRIIDDNERVITYIYINNTPYEIFKSIVEFIYTGVITTKKNLDETIEAAKYYELEYLVNFCENIKQGAEELNPSIGTYLNDETGKYLLETYYNKRRYSDLVFEIDGRKIKAHKSIVATRCEVLKRMFSSSFKEGSGKIVIEESTYSAVRALLHYIYSDHAPIQDSEDPVAILSIANSYGITRLITLCELFISKQVEVATANGIENAEIDVIGLLELSQAFNANQLAAFCLHFISNNYEPMSKRKEFKSLSTKNREYVEQHRWPPQSYIKELEAYDKAVRSNGGETSFNSEKCSVM